MKSLIKKLVWSLATASILLTASAQGTPKIAVADLDKLFNSYWKTKQAQALIADSQASYTKTGNEMLEDYKKLNEDYKKLSDSAADPAVSGDEKERRKKQAEQKLVEIRERQGNLQQFKQSMEANLGESMKRSRDNLVREIREKVIEQGKKGGYTMVLDLTGQTTAGSPLVLFNAGGNDLTDEVLAQLNANAPANLPAEIKPAPPGASVPAKDEKKGKK